MNRPAEDFIEALDADRLSTQELEALAASLGGDQPRLQALAREWRIHRLLGLSRSADDSGPRLVASLRYARPIHAGGDAAFAERVKARIHPRHAASHWRWSAVAAAVMALVGALALLATVGGPAASPLATVVVAEGAQVIRADGSQAPLVGAIDDGDVVVTGSQPATLAWIDEPTTLIVAPLSRLRIGIDSGVKRVRLEHGRLDADVAPQEPGRAFVVATPAAEATVIGTSLTMQHDETGTRLSVAHGRVRLISKVGQAVEVAAGQSAAASALAPAALLTDTPGSAVPGAGFVPPFIFDLAASTGPSLLPDGEALRPSYRREFAGILAGTDQGQRPAPWQANSWLPEGAGVFALEDERASGQRAFSLRSTTAHDAVQAFLWPPVPLPAGRVWRLTLDCLVDEGAEARIAIGLENVRSHDLALAPTAGRWQRIGCRIPAAAQVRGFNLLLQLHRAGGGQALRFKDVRLVAEP